MNPIHHELLFRCIQEENTEHPLLLILFLDVGNKKVNLLVETTWSHHLVPKTLIPVSSQWTEWDANNCFITASSKCFRLLKHSFYAFFIVAGLIRCLLYTSPSPRDGLLSRMPSSA